MILYVKSLISGDCKHYQLENVKDIYPILEEYGVEVSLVAFCRSHKDAAFKIAEHLTKGETHSWIEDGSYSTKDFKTWFEGLVGHPSPLANSLTDDLVLLDDRTWGTAHLKNMHIAHHAPGMIRVRTTTPYRLFQYSKITLYGYNHNLYQTVQSDTGLMEMCLSFEREHVGNGILKNAESVIGRLKLYEAIYQLLNESKLRFRIFSSDDVSVIEILSSVKSDDRKPLWKKQTNEEWDKNTILEEVRTAIERVRKSAYPE